MIEKVPCPSCGKPLARSLLQAGFSTCHHCGGSLEALRRQVASSPSLASTQSSEAAGQVVAGQGPNLHPTVMLEGQPSQATSTLSSSPSPELIRRRVTAESGVIGSSPPWQEQPPAQLGTRTQDSSSARLPTVSRAGLGVGPASGQVPGWAGRTVVPAPTTQLEAIEAPGNGEILDAEPVAKQPTLSPDLTTGSVMSSAGAASPPSSSLMPAMSSVRTVKIVRRRSTAEWLLPIAMLLAFAMTLVVVLLLLLNRGSAPTPSP